MSLNDTILDYLRSKGAVVETANDGPWVQAFGDVSAEYRAISEGCAIYPNLRRSLIQVTGKDRAAWLHNLCTQNIKLLKPGDGVYAFVLNLKGRILFDMTVWADADALWLDLDRRSLSFALKHFTKYTITEDVVLTDCSDAFSRWVVLGRGANALLTRIGPSHLSSMAHWQHELATVIDVPVRFIRSDMYGVFAVELSVAMDQSRQVANSLIDQGTPCNVLCVGLNAVEIRRVEAGIPWPITDLFDDILPAETRQLERAVNFQKGCYLGQEIVERMRSRGGLSRSLVGLEFDNQPPLPTSDHRPALQHDDHAVGILTSVGRSEALQRWIGLGYVKLSDANPGTGLSIAAGTNTVCAKVHERPIIKSQ